MTEYLQSVYAGILGGLVGASILLPLYICNLADSAKTYIRARYALELISLGEDSSKREYHDAVQDAKIDGLAGKLLGGRKALFDACRKGRATRHFIEE